MTNIVPFDVLLNTPPKLPEVFIKPVEAKDCFLIDYATLQLLIYLASKSTVGRKEKCFVAEATAILKGEADDN